MPFPAVDSFIEQRDRVRAACESIGRDPDTMIMSVAQIVCCGSTEGDVIRRAATIGRATGELRQNGAAGSPAEVLDKLATFAEAGASRVYLQLMDLDDLDHLHVIAEEVAKLLP